METGVARRLHQGRLQLFLRRVEPNGGVGPEFAQRDQAILIASRRHHTSRAQESGDLNCQPARDPGSPRTRTFSP